MGLVGERDGSIIVRQLAATILIFGCEGDAVVDVQEAGISASRPDGGSGLDLIVLGVDVT